VGRLFLYLDQRINMCWYVPHTDHVRPFDLEWTRNFHRGEIIEELVHLHHLNDYIKIYI
jgi:hypothetical protein